MNTTKIAVTAATVVVLAATPAAAPASGCSKADDNCRIALNHNEVLDRT
jgi:hypothetical protein